MSRTNRALPLPIRAFRRRAFTLIELLVVITIILVLIGILVPALSSSQRTAKRVASQSQLKGIAAGIESYATTFNGYPGYFSEDTVNTEKTNFTSTENLVLSLMGGVDPINTAGSDFNFTVNGKNHHVFFNKIADGPRMGNGRKLDAFYAAKPDELGVIKDGTGVALGGRNMPELIDTTSGMPILYYRAINSGTTPVGDTTADTGKFALQNNDLYLDGVLAGSDNRSADQTTSLINPTNSDAKNNLAWAVTNQKLSNVPATPGVTDANNTNDVVAGKYVLVAPGLDGVYFSQDQLGDGTVTGITGYDQLGGFDDVVHIGGQ